MRADRAGAGGFVAEAMLAVAQVHRDEPTISLREHHRRRYASPREVHRGREASGPCRDAARRERLAVGDAAELDQTVGGATDEDGARHVRGAAEPLAHPQHRAVVAIERERAARARDDDSIAAHERRRGVELVDLRAPPLPETETARR